MLYLLYLFVDLTYNNVIHKQNSKLKLMQKYLVFTSILGLLFSCSSKDETIDKVLSPPIDSTSPMISVIGVSNGDVVEQNTTIDFSITDQDSEITSVIYMDNVEILSFAGKQFSLELDPFDYLNGTRTLTIESFDSYGNSSTLTRAFELKKLLFVHSDTQLPEVLGNPDLEVYISINTLEGKLLDYRKIDGNQENRFYAPDAVDRQNIIATMYLTYPDFPDRMSSFISFGNLSPGTTTISANEVALRRPQFQKNNSFQLSMTDALETTNFKMKGQEFSLETSGSATGNFLATINFDPDLDDEMFIYSKPSDANALQDYRYIFIDNFTDGAISFSDFNSSNGSAVLQFPEDLIDYRLTFHGYRNQSDYDEWKYTELFQELNPTSSTIEVPIFEEFQIYEKVITANLNNNTNYIFRGKGLGETIIPDWVVTVNGDLVQTLGDYDHMQIAATFKGNPVESSVNRLSWTFSQKNTPQLSLPFESFEIPQEVNTRLQSLGILPSDANQMETLSISLQQYEKNYDFVDGIFVGYGNSNYYGDQESMSFVIKDGINN